MASRTRSPQHILSEAFALRADAYRRWRSAADREPLAAMRSLYEELAHLECDRYQELVQRFLDSGSSMARSLAAAGAEGRSGPVSRRERGLASGSRRHPPLRAAAVAAEAERRTWSALLKRTGDTAPERSLLTALVEDARRTRDLVVRR